MQELPVVLIDNGDVNSGIKIAAYDASALRAKAGRLDTPCLNAPARRRGVAASR